MAATWWCRDREILLAGPAGTGKTRFWLERLYFLLEKYPGIRALLVRKTRASLTESALVTWEKHVLGPHHPAIGAIRRHNRSSYVFPNGSECILAGLDRPDRMLSAEYDLVYVCEATEITETDWETLISRLRGHAMPWSQIVADCNPSSPNHWLRRRCLAGKCRLVETTHRDNPLLWDAELEDWTQFGEKYVEKTLGSLTGVRRKRFLEGLWAAAEGLVYPEFERAVVPRPGQTPSPTVISAAALDWGWNDPTAVVVGLLGQDGKLRLVEEIYETRLPISSLVERLRLLCRTWRIEAIYCDPSRPELIDHLSMAGLPATAHRIRAIDTGIAMVSSRLLRRTLEIWDNLPATVRELGEYQWAVGKDGAIKRAPVDASNHAMDAMRYLICGVDEGRDYAETVPENTEISEATEQARRLGLPDPEAEAERLAREKRQRQLSEEMWGDWQG